MAQADDARKCVGFKHDLEDALHHLEEISNTKGLPDQVEEQVRNLQDMLRAVTKYIENNRFYARDAESLPKRS